MKNISIIFLAAVLAVFQGCTKDLPLFSNSFVAFDYASSSSTSINSQGSFTGQYVVKYSGIKPSSNLEVYFSVSPGNGLQENIDYKVLTPNGTITFLPGVYERYISIEWLPHELDSVKDNTLTLSLESSNMDISLGNPGPDTNYKSIVIQKYNP